MKLAPLSPMSLKFLVVIVQLLVFGGHVSPRKLSYNTAMGINYMRAVRSFEIPYLPVLFGDNIIVWNPCMTLQNTSTLFSLIKPPITNPNMLYSVLMYDPDVPGPMEANQTIYLHYLAVNGKVSTEPTVVNDYVVPAPPIGVHHYVILMAEQKKVMDTTTIPNRFFYDFKSYVSKQKRIMYGNVFRVPAPGELCPLVDGSSSLHIHWILIALLIAILCV